MSTVTRPRGPLPARVYWTRRLLVVLLALLLVFGLARLLGGSGAGDPTARAVGARPSITPTPTATPTPAATATVGPTVAPQVTVAPSASSGAKAGGTATAPAAPLATPTGTCADSDVVAVPSAKRRADAGRPVVLDVALTTRSTPACTWVVSASSLVVKVTSGDEDFWSTQQCPGAVLKQSVVVRQDVATTVQVAWNGQRSDSDCTRSTAWAEPGYYHVIAAAFGADPVDEQFRLHTPKARTVVKAPSAKMKAAKVKAARVKAAKERAAKAKAAKVKAAKAKADKVGSRKRS